MCTLLNSFYFFERARINRHFNEFTSTDMTIEKLQKIVICPVEASLKNKNQVASLVERLHSWKVGEQVPHRQAYEGEDFERLASQGVILGSGTSIHWPS